MKTFNALDAACPTPRPPRSHPTLPPIPHPDVRALLGDDALLNRVAADVFRERNLRDAVSAPLPNAFPDAPHLVVCASSELDPTSYLEPATARVVTFDHVTRSCVATRDATPTELGDEPSASLAAALRAAAAPYIADAYPSGVFAAFPGPRGADPNVAGSNPTGDGDATAPVSIATLVVSAEKLSPGNFWNARWRSTWTTTRRGDAMVVGGVVAVAAHYFEDGNTQMSSDFAFEPIHVALPPGADCHVAAREVVRAVSRAEDGYRARLETFYEENEATTLRALRRALPVTRTKFAWERASHELAARRRGEELVEAANARAAAKAGA